MMGLVLLVLLIACSNVALLIMARNQARQREFSLRMAVGAERGDFFRQLLTESSLLVIAGAGLGWGFALLATNALAAWSGIETGLGPDRSVLLFTLAISAISALAFGFSPLWIALRAPVSGVLRATASNLTQDRHRVFGGRALMASQVAVCLLLLVAAALLLHTLRNYETQDLGMQVDGLLVFQSLLDALKPPVRPWRSIAVCSTGFARCREWKQRRSCKIASARAGAATMTMITRRRQSDRENFGPNASVRSNDVGPDYFHTLGVPIVAGRDITSDDTPSSLPVVVVNETFAKTYLAERESAGTQSLG